MSGLSLCDLCLCYWILGSQFSNKYLLIYLHKIRPPPKKKNFSTLGMHVHLVHPLATLCTKRSCECQSTYVDNIVVLLVRHIRHDLLYYSFISFILLVSGNIAHKVKCRHKENNQLQPPSPSPNSTQLNSSCEETLLSALCVHAATIHTLFYFILF